VERQGLLMIWRRRVENIGIEETLRTRYYPCVRNESRGGVFVFVRLEQQYVCILYREDRTLTTLCIRLYTYICISHKNTIRREQ